MLFFQGIRPTFLSFLLALGALLPSCAQKPLAPELRKQIEKVSAFSALGSEFTFDVISRTVIFSRERGLEVSAWKVDETFRSLLEKGSVARGKDFVPLSLDENELQKALNVRESRWKKVLGTHSQLLLDHLFRKADEQGIHYLFLLTPLESHENFPLHKGNMGIYCDDRSGKSKSNIKSRAYAYFFLDFSLWDVAARKKIFREAIDPGFTREMTFAECKETAELKDPVEALKEPVEHTMDLLVEKVFAKMGWEKSVP